MAFNVVVFGETGVGKSSVVNMFKGDKSALVGNGAQGVTFAHNSYEKHIFETSFRVFDTVGLNEGAAGAMDAATAIEELYKLIMGLENGVSLLVYVMRAPRITATGRKNYDLFRSLCDETVPIVMVVTGLEDMQDMDEWWWDNQHAFDKCYMSFRAVACVTGTKGKHRNGAHIFEDEFAASKEKLEKVIGGHYSRTPWKMAKQPWFARVAVRVHTKLAGVFRFAPMSTNKLCQLLQDYGGLTKKEALKRVKQAMK
jgi:GTPase Era involved in 16S rRNA processing